MQLIATYRVIKEFSPTTQTLSHEGVSVNQSTLTEDTMLWNYGDETPEGDLMLVRDSPRLGSLTYVMVTAGEVEENMEQEQTPQ
jgi:hypothetical protein